MKTSTLLTSCFLLFSMSLFAQTQTKTKSLRVSENKYKINLPDHWGKGNKVWQVLTDKLPLVCEELKDKELCGDDCNPKYTVELYLTDAEDLEYYTTKTTPPAFTSTRHLANITRQNSGVYEIPYNPEKTYYAQNSNTWKVNTFYSFRCYLLLVDKEEKIITRMILVDTNEVWNVYRSINLSNSGDFSTKTPDEFIEKNKEKVNPTLKELYAIIEQKILAL
jgi:hypothetical protein